MSAIDKNSKVEEKIENAKNVLIELKSELSGENSEKLHEALKSLVKAKNSIIPSEYYQKRVRKELRKSFREAKSEDSENKYWEKIKQKAEDKLDSGKCTTRQKAISEILKTEEGRELYEKYRNEKRKNSEKSLRERVSG